jgi:muramoyltetrapeptide carboxypeptidase
VRTLRVRVVAPAGPVRPERLRAGAAALGARGCELRWSPAVEDVWGHLAGRDEARAEDLHDALLDPWAEVVWAARGGFGGLRLLPRLDLPRLAARPAEGRPPLVGYSDLTSLQNALAGRLDWPCWHAPMIASELADPLDEVTEAGLEALLASLRNVPARLLLGQTQAGDWTRRDGPWPDSPARLILAAPAFQLELAFHHTHVWTRGRAAGGVAGGNLSVWGSLYGSGWERDPAHCLLALEDHGEFPFRLDRHLTQLANSGDLEHCAGLLLGSFARCEEPDPDKSTFTAEQLLRQAAHKVRGPVLAGLPFGHTAPRIPLPFHGSATVEA